MSWIDAKHISKPKNDFTKHDVYFGTLPIHGFSSFRDYAYGYYENGNIGIITFIKNIPNPFNR